MLMLDAAVAAVINQEAAVVPGLDRGLGNELLRKKIIKIRCLHIKYQISILICSCAAAGMLFFIWAQAAGVQIRPRGVRIRKPSCIR